ncbi:MAG: hypothetical protein IJ635_11010 [Bacteroidaceae bacterium]|nr:hypothetical protein [Bacteroidaceae bacterium]
MKKIFLLTVWVVIMPMCVYAQTPVSKERANNALSRMPKNEAQLPEQDKNIQKTGIDQEQQGVTKVDASSNKVKSITVQNGTLQKGKEVSTGGFDDIMNRKKAEADKKVKVLSEEELERLTSEQRTAYYEKLLTQKYAQLNNYENERATLVNEIATLKQQISDETKQLNTLTQRLNRTPNDTRLQNDYSKRDSSVKEKKLRKSKKEKRKKAVENQISNLKGEIERLHESCPDCKK